MLDTRVTSFTYIWLLFCVYASKLIFLRLNLKFIFPRLITNRWLTLCITLAFLVQDCFPYNLLLIIFSIKNLDRLRLYTFKRLHNLLNFWRYVTFLFTIIPFRINDGLATISFSVNQIDVRNYFFSFKTTIIRVKIVVQ